MSDLLDALGLPGGSSLERLDFVETKDHLGDRAKDSGWEAIKSVVWWWVSAHRVTIAPDCPYESE